MDPVEGVDAIPPEEPPPRPPDEAEEIIRAGSPARLVVRVAAVLLIASAVAVGAHALRLRAKRIGARSAPMASVPLGTFRMGVEHGPVDETPAHLVKVASFQLDVTEVTVAAYSLCVSEGRCTPARKQEGCNYGRDDRDDHPINCVDWYQANAFCAWAKKRLPTEEEWEYAARGEDGRKLPWGEAPPGPARLNVCDSACRLTALRESGEEPAVMYDQSDGWGATARVGSFPAGDSPFGLKDMAGNVAEWTASAYCLYGGPAGAACSDPRRVTRGGSFRSAARIEVESTTRAPIVPSAWSDSLGFRCAR